MLRFNKRKTDLIPLPHRPAPHADRQGVALVGIVKDEVLDIAEWIAFHAHVGVSQFYIYDNGSTDGTTELLHCLAQHFPITIVPWVRFLDEPNPQRLAYAHALSNFGARWRWMMFVDVDEFVVPKEHGSIGDALDALSHLPAVCLPWHMFGTGGHGPRPEGLVIENYLERAPMPPAPERIKLLSYKSIVDPARVTASGSHRFALEEIGRTMYNDAGEAFSWNDWNKPEFATARLLQLNHYFTKSDSEFEAKLNRGRVSRGGSFLPKTPVERRSLIEAELETDETILRFAPSVRALLRDMGV